MPVSAILPVHDEGSVLARVLESVDRQSHPPDEIVIVLDACADESEAIALRHGGKILAVRARNTAVAVMAGVAAAEHEVLVLFDGNTVVPVDYVERLLEAAHRTRADVVEWHGGLLLLSRATLDRFGPFSPIALWTLEYFLRVESREGVVVRLHGPYTRLKGSPLARNIRYGLDYAELADRYGLAPFFRIGTKSGLLPDLFATAGTVVGHLRRHRLGWALRELAAAVRSI